MKKPKVISVEEGKLSHYIQIENGVGLPINIPVIHVMDGIAERMLAESMLKATHRSRWINYNQYHVSKKPINQI